MLKTQPVFAGNTQLVTSDVVRALRGITADAVHAAVERGDLRFVWNVSRGRKIPELRFLLREVTDPESASLLTLASVISLILGETRTRWRGAEICQLLLVSRPTLHRLYHRRILPGRLQDGTLWFSRATMTSFLTQRLLTAN